MITLTGNEHFTYDGMPIGLLLNDFWSWSSSDLLNNTLRGALAEFIVGSALGVDFSTCRRDWESFDLLSSSGYRIEVKSSAYLQSWEQSKLSRIQFSIHPSRSWTSDSGYSDAIVRQSDIYVFCLFACKEKSSSNPLDLTQWEFYILPTKVLNDTCGEQVTITLSSLLRLSPIKANYGDLANKIEEVCKNGS
jgi:hypothetical protein